MSKKRKEFEQWGDMTARLFPELYYTDIENKTPKFEDQRVIARTVTFQVTDACNLACKYCYQINKGRRRMSMETAKKFVDLLLDADESNKYINPSISPFIIIEFIGGEPLLEIDLIDEIMTYFTEQAFVKRHPWATRYMVSLCSNGVLYFEPNVQRFFRKHKNHLSLNITIDGNKELHDSCRVFPDGRPSYDMAVAAAKDWMDNKHGYMGSKITIAPGNITYLYDALVHMIDLGYLEINANCVYEEGWNIEYARELYNQMKHFSDYLLDNNLDEVYCSLYEEHFFHPKEEGDDENWCWGAGTPILTDHGYVPIENIQVGDLVYTHDGTLKPVINVMSHRAENVVNIKMSGVFDLVCTDNHKLFTRMFKHRGHKGEKHYEPINKSAVKDIRHEDLIKLFQLPTNDLGETNPIAYIVGRYIGDGWSYCENTGHVICCSFDEKDMLKEQLSKANIGYYTNENEPVVEFIIGRDTNNENNVRLHDILKECGQLAHGKKVPSICLGWNKQSLLELIRGYIDANGYISTNGQFRINTVSYRLAQDVMLILRTLGFTPTCYKNNGIKDRYEIYFYPDPDRAKYVHFEDNELYTFGLKYEEVEPQTVYNITVAENHSYVAGGIVSSNCGGTGVMLSCDPGGYLYPCIRYMESSLGDEQEPMRIGHVDFGLETNDKEVQIVKCLNCITRRTQSTDECYYCPIAEGCSWCSAYNYQVFGTADKRATYICEMHKARSLANVYYWNKRYKKNNEDKKYYMWCPKEWAIPIIGENEYKYLLDISGSKEYSTSKPEEYTFSNYEKSTDFIKQRNDIVYES